MIFLTELHFDIPLCTKTAGRTPDVPRTFGIDFDPAPHGAGWRNVEHPNP